MAKKKKKAKSKDKDIMGKHMMPGMPPKVMLNKNMKSLAKKMGMNY